MPFLFFSIMCMCSRSWPCSLTRELETTKDSWTWQSCLLVHAALLLCWLCTPFLDMTHQAHSKGLEWSSLWRCWWVLSNTMSLLSSWRKPGLSLIMFAIHWTPSNALALRSYTARVDYSRLMFYVTRRYVICVQMSVFHPKTSCWLCIIAFRQKQPCWTHQKSELSGGILEACIWTKPGCCRTWMDNEKWDDAGATHTYLHI